MTAPVFLVDPSSRVPAPGDTVVLDGPEGRHAATVQRLGPGEGLDLVDGQGLRLRCTVRTAVPGGLEAVVDRVVREEAGPVDLVLVQALAKGERDEAAVEAATELGAGAVIPWQAARSVVVWRGERAERGRRRWEATVRAATKQSRRSHLPSVEPAVDTRALARLVARTTADGGAVLVLHEEAEAPLTALDLPPVAGSTRPPVPGALPVSGDPPASGGLPVSGGRPASGGLPGTGDPPVSGGPPAPDDRSHLAPVRPRIAVVVGPEGGITPEELALLEEAGALAVRLGPHVLRTSTAGPAALAVLAARLGLWD